MRVHMAQMQPCQLPSTHLRAQLPDGSPVERRLQGAQLVQDAAQRPDVHREAHGLAVVDLGGGVGGRARLNSGEGGEAAA